MTGEEPIKSELLLKIVEGDKEKVAKSDTHDSPSGTPGGSSTPVKTDAERRFEETQRRRVRSILSDSEARLLTRQQRLDKVAKMATKSHKDRVQEFNTKLELATDHHDIPKVS